MESAGLRASYKLTPPLKGVLVRSIWPTSPLAAVAGPDDIIMRFDGIQVACDGTVPFRFVSDLRILRGTSCAKVGVGPQIGLLPCLCYCGQHK